MSYTDLDAHSASRTLHSPDMVTTGARDATSASPRVPRRRRRWLLLAAGGLLVAAIGGNVLLISAVHEREPMLVVARNVGWGHRLSTGDLATVDMLPDARRFAIPHARRGEVVGQVAATNLTAGQVLAPRDVTAQVVPGPGQQLVGLRVEPGRFPARGLAPNDPVAVTPVPADSTSSSGAEPTGPSFRARVVQASPPDADGAITVDVLVPDATAPQASSAAARGALITLLGPPR